MAGEALLMSPRRAATHDRPTHTRVGACRGLTPSSIPGSGAQAEVNVTLSDSAAQFGAG